MYPADVSPIRKFPFGIYRYIPLEKKLKFQGRVHELGIYLSYGTREPSIADIEAENCTGKQTSIFVARKFGSKRLRAI